MGFSLRSCLTWMGWNLRPYQTVTKLGSVIFSQYLRLSIVIWQISTLFDPCAAEPSSNYCRTQAGQSEQQPQFLLLMSHISIPRLRHLGSLVVNRYKPHACLVERGNCLPDSLYFLYACVFIDSWNTKGHVLWVKKIFLEDYPWMLF